MVERLIRNQQVSGSIPEGGSSYLPTHHSNQASTGEYVATIAYCEKCHTPQTNGHPDTARRFAGGQTFATPAGSVVTPTSLPTKIRESAPGITLAFGTGSRFFEKEFGTIKLPKIGPDRFTVMHYIAYSGLTEGDMAALFAYLQTRTPASQNMESHP